MREQRDAAHRIAHTIASGTLCLIAVLAVILSSAAWWVSSLVGDTDRYVSTVAPLIKNPAVNKAVADRLTEAIVTQLDLDGRSQAGALVSAFVEKQIAKTVATAVASPQFAAVWEEANREAHTQVVAVLSGEGNRAVTARGDTISVNVAGLLDTIDTRLAARGLDLGTLPAVDAEFVLYQGDDLGTAQAAFRVLHRLNWALPIVAFAASAGAIVLANRRRRTATGLALATIIGVALVAGVLALARSNVPELLGLHNDEAARVIFSGVTRPWREALITWGAVAAVALLVSRFAGRPKREPLPPRP